MKDYMDKFFIPASVVMILFYLIYFIKMFVQKRQGIQTNQLGKRKEKKSRIVEIIMSIATCTIVVAQLLSIILGWNRLPDNMRLIGCVIGLTGDFIFLIAVVTMRDSWRAGIPDEDKTTLISNGIYNYSRNPAFLGFDLMYIGILIMYFNIALLIFTIWVVVMLHLQILQEEKFLAAVFGEEYIQYKEHTLRYLGRK